MKILIILCLTIFLQANCTQKNIQKSDKLFYKATQTKSSVEQIELLEDALEACFSYELEVSLLGLKVEQSSSKEEKLKLYDQILESLSQIENNDALVKAQQKKVNRAIALLYKKENPELSMVYEQKADAQERDKAKSLKDYTLWMLFVFLLFVYAFSSFFGGKS